MCALSPQGCWCGFRGANGNVWGMRRVHMGNCGSAVLSSFRQHFSFTGERDDPAGGWDSGYTHVQEGECIM